MRMTLAAITGRIGCAFGKHRRSKGRVRLIDGIYRSHCSYCDVAMREGGEDGWIVDTGAPAAKNSGRLLDL